MDVDVEAEDPDALYVDASPIDLVDATAPFGHMQVDASSERHPVHKVWSDAYRESGSRREERVVFRAPFTEERARRDVDAVRAALRLHCSGLDHDRALQRSDHDHDHQCSDGSSRDEIWLGLESPFTAQIYAGVGWKVSECGAPPRQVMVSAAAAAQCCRSLALRCQWPRLRLLLLWDTLDDETSLLIGEWLL